MEPMLAFGSYDLAEALLRALYSAKTQEHYRLRKAALEQTLEADLLVALAAEDGVVADTKTAVHAGQWQLGKR
jgi:hypothetical protein